MKIKSKLITNVDFRKAAQTKTDSKHFAVTTPEKVLIYQNISFVWLMNLVLNAIHDLDFPDDISTHGLN